MLKKKILVSLLTAVVTLSMLAGCGNKQENAGSNSDSTGSTNTSGSTQMWKRKRQFLQMRKYP